MALPTLPPPLQQQQVDAAISLQVGFVANTSAAQSLYRGCKRSAAWRRAVSKLEEQRLPNFVIFGDTWKTSTARSSHYNPRGHLPGTLRREACCGE